MALATAHARNEGRLRADLQEHYGIDLDHAMAGLHTPHHIACLAVNLPPGSRVLADEDPDTAWGLRDVLVAALLNDFRMFTWSLQGQQKRGNPPDLVGPSAMTKPKGRSLPARALSVGELMNKLRKPRRDNA